MLHFFWHIPGVCRRQGDRAALQYVYLCDAVLLFAQRGNQRSELEVEVGDADPELFFVHVRDRTSQSLIAITIDKAICN
jgi:hypothetical protein